MYVIRCLLKSKRRRCSGGFQRSEGGRWSHPVVTEFLKMTVLYKGCRWCNSSNQVESFLGMDASCNPDLDHLDRERSVACLPIMWSMIHQNGMGMQPTATVESAVYSKSDGVA